MSLLIAQQDVANAVAAAATAWSGPFTLKIQYENRDLIDISKQLDPYATVETVFMGGHQADLNPKPLTVQYGQIVLSACAKLGAGSQGAARILDHFTSYLELKNFSLIRTHSGVANRAIQKAGWEIYPLIIPFWYHRVAT